jgi:hypothetical protein
MSVGNVDSQDRGSGARFNDGKARLDLIPLSSLTDCANVFDYGRKKYAAWNWAKGMDWSVPYGCLLRHMAAWFNGEDNDPESGLPHLGHAMCNLVMLSTFARTFQEGDDRPAKWMTADPARAPDSVSMAPPTYKEQPNTPIASYEEQAVAHHAIEAPMEPPILSAVFADPERDDDEGTQGEPPRDAA